MSQDANDQLILIGGFSGTGKSTALKNIKDQEKWLYLNTEAGKRLPFKSKFRSFRISDPYQIFEAFDHGTYNPDVKGIIIDSLTFLMDMYETQYVLKSANTMKAWGEFSQFFKELMQEKVTIFSKPVIITAHVREDLDEKAMEYKTSIPIKGALKNNGVESYFSTVLAAKKMQVKDLEPFKSDLLHITDEEMELGFKHVFQTRITKNTIGERIRSPIDLFTKEQTYTDNDAQMILSHLDAYYK